MHTYIQTYMHYSIASRRNRDAHVGISEHTLIYIYIYKQKWTSSLSTWTRVYIEIYTYAHRHTCACVCVCMSVSLSCGCDSIAKGSGDGFGCSVCNEAFLLHPHQEQTNYLCINFFFVNEPTYVYNDIHVPTYGTLNTNKCVYVYLWLVYFGYPGIVYLAAASLEEPIAALDVRPQPLTPPKYPNSRP